jgi:hypothetical protein
MALLHQPLLTDHRRKPSLINVFVKLHMLYTTLHTTRDLRGSRLFNG